ncbi:leukocyte elastase inhibitor isoform X2 [Oreochromis niloticus]|nr:leukocyte elastase inhibitor-like isoform X2 [Oreochromis niloticus]
MDGREKRALHFLIFAAYLVVSSSPSAGLIRLAVNGSTQCSGRVEIYNSYSYPYYSWGTVCDDGWDLKDAEVVCREQSYGIALEALGSAYFGQGTGTFLHSNVDCSGSETSLDNCRYSSYISYYCHHGRDAGVVCSVSNPEPTISLYSNEVTWGQDVSITCSVSEKFSGGTFILQKTSGSFSQSQTSSTSSVTFNLHNVNFDHDGLYQCQYMKTSQRFSSSSVRLSVTERNQCRGRLWSTRNPNKQKTLQAEARKNPDRLTTKEKWMSLSNNNKTGNIFFSPFSISSALAMVMLGARGNTATQMSECLQAKDCWGDVHSSFAKLLTELKRPEAPFTFSVANRLYREKSCPFTQKFLIQSKKHYSTELESVDFKTRSEEVRIDVNNWVQKNTPGNITEVVDEDDLNELTRLVLFTATHFRGSWKKDFSWSKTYDAQFWLKKNDSKPVKMMKQEGNFACTFIEEANCKILEMPYSGEEVSMLIFLPAEIEDDTTGLEKLEKELTSEKFVAWTHPGKMQTCYIDVRLPRFTLEETYDLNTVLSSMSMVDAFDHTKCDFSGMSGHKDLVLSKVIHKAFVKVHEKATEATFVDMCWFEYCSGKIMRGNLNSFIADHPFLFFIRHNPTMNILFAGRFCCPV